MTVFLTKSKKFPPLSNEAIFHNDKELYLGANGHKHCKKILESIICTIIDVPMFLLVINLLNGTICSLDYQAKDECPKGNDMAISRTSNKRRHDKPQLEPKIPAEASKKPWELTPQLIYIILLRLSSFYWESFTINL